jgi:hypothetical protein
MTEGPHDAAPEEDPEQHIGEQIDDPWTDEMQDDWETHTIEGID